MDTIICGASAFRYHRIPPWLLARLPDDIDLSTSEGRRALGRADSYLSYLPLPLDVLVRDRCERHACSGIRFHLWQGEMPPSSLSDVGSYVQVTSPAMTLATMAATMNYYELTMAAYEMCGTFSAMRLSPEHAEAVRAAMARRDSFGDWRPVLDRKGSLTTMWSRPPLLEVGELVRFACSLKGRRWSRRLIEATESVAGVCASPLEVQAAMLLAGRRARGGEGMGPVELNHPLRLDAAARTLAERDRFVVDQYYEGDPPVAIELQGAVVHDDERSAMRDADRYLALGSMGVQCLPVTYSQLVDDRRYERLVRHLCELLGRTYRERAERQRAAERELRRHVFSDWTRLGK